MYVIIFGICTIGHHLGILQCMMEIVYCTQIQVKILREDPGSLYSRDLQLLLIIVANGANHLCRAPWFKLQVSTKIRPASTPRLLPETNLFTSFNANLRSK